MALRPNRFIQYTDRDKSITTTGPFKAVKTGARAGTTTLLGLNPRRVESGTKASQLLRKQRTVLQEEVELVEVGNELRAELAFNAPKCENRPIGRETDRDNFCCFHSDRRGTARRLPAPLKT